MSHPAILHRSAGVVGTGPDRLRRLVLAVRPGPVGAGNCCLLGDVTGTLTGGPGRFTAALTGHTLTVDVTADTIAFQGGWWYRGEWTVTPHDEGALLTHRVHNAATRLRWGVPLANRFSLGIDERTRAHVRDTLARIGHTLECDVRLL